MNFKIGDIVTRKSHNHDTVFVITLVDGDIAYLKGVDERLVADTPVSDLVYKKEFKTDDEDFMRKIESYSERNVEEYFYLPGKVLHIDGDPDYLDRCLNFYKKSKVMAFGINAKEKDIAINIKKYLEDTNPSIVVITGHDARYKGDTYKNSSFFVDAVKEARKYEKSHEKLIIVAGGCQSNYEELIKSGANFASSPKRVNLHALDPAVVAASVSLSDKSADIDLIGILEKTKYGSEGIGGIITKGAMYVGYPR